MIFGTKPVYKFAVYNKRKMHSMGRAYKFDECPVEISECPIKIVNDKAELFFSGPIFNSYVISTEEKVKILKSFDEKLTFTKDNVKDGLLYTFKIVNEDDTTREVILFAFDEFFPGYKTNGKLIISNDKNVHFQCKLGNGIIVLQTNETKKEVEGMLAHLDDKGPIFVEINSPIERTSVTVIKDLNNMKIVENGNISGILIGCKDIKVKQEVDVYVKNVYPGSYCFIEDIKPGFAEVQLIGKQGDHYNVKFKEFTGVCKDRKVSKTMKGMISKIKGNSFYFTQCSLDTERTKDFESVSVLKKVKVNTEADIKNDEANAIEFIRSQIEGENGRLEEHRTKENKNTSIKDKKTDKNANIKQLFNKYLGLLKEHDNLALFYMKYLYDEGELTQSAVNKIVKDASAKFPSIASQTFDDIKIVQMIFNSSKSMAGFQKLLAEEEGKTKLIKDNLQYFSYSIDYIYNNIASPRTIVESTIDNNCSNWLLYANKESGNYKRNLFRRIAKMNFKKNVMKGVFKSWLEFEQAEGENVEEVHLAEQEYLKQANK